MCIYFELHFGTRFEDFCCMLLSSRRIRRERRKEEEEGKKKNLYFMVIFSYYCHSFINGVKFAFTK